MRKEIKSCPFAVVKIFKLATGDCGDVGVENVLRKQATKKIRSNRTLEQEGLR